MDSFWMGDMLFGDNIAGGSCGEFELWDNIVQDNSKVFEMGQ